MLKVIAAPGINAPLLHRPKSYITDARIVAVDDSHYYRSMIADGDLIEVDEKEWLAQQAADDKAEQEAIAAAEPAKAEAAKAAKKTPVK